MVGIHFFQSLHKSVNTVINTYQLQIIPLQTFNERNEKKLQIEKNIS